MNPLQDMLKHAVNFYRDVVEREEGDGHWSYTCRRGLWSVRGPGARVEAMRLYRQHARDGEYDEEPMP